MTLSKRLRKIAELEEAWRHIYQKGRASKSPQTRKAVDDFSSLSGIHLRSVQRALARGTYEFKPMEPKFIKKKSGKKRPIAVYTLKDRIVQRAVLQVVQSRLVGTGVLFHEGSHGGVTRRGVRTAYGRLTEHSREGRVWYLRSDIEKFFDKIPRKRAIGLLQEHLPMDPQFLRILEEASTAIFPDEIEFTDDQRAMFPTEDTGVAQGNCLSALLGNVLLLEFDRILNEGETACIRYIDDFIILGETQSAVRSAFAKAKEILAAHGLKAYDPRAKNDKAKEGTLLKAVNFLGCDYTQGKIRPDDNATNKFKQNIQGLLNKSAKAIRNGDLLSKPDYSLSVVETLHNVSLMVQHWGNHYAFCNADDEMRELDAAIGKMIRKYLAEYSRYRAKLEGRELRVAQGVWSLLDCKKDPLFPDEIDTT